MTRRRKIIVPALLVAAGVYLLAGCIFIPTFNAPQDKRQDASKQVGLPGSKKPIRVGQASRDEIIRLLGTPRYSRPDESAVAYQWTVSNGIWIWPFCFQAYTQTGKRTLVLEFDRAGVLSAFHVEAINGNVMYPDARPQPPQGMIWWPAHRGVGEAMPSLPPELPPTYNR